MPALSIQPPFPIFTGIDGQPLEDGFILIGAANLDPQGNPITVYWDEALLVPATQPIRTTGGYPSRSGTPARLYVNSDYSIRVLNKNGSVLYSSPVATEQYSDAVVTVASSNVTFTQGGVGAATITAQNKMRQRVSILDYTGVDPTGLTDSTAGIQAAITYAKTLTSPELIIDAGTYLVSATLTFDLPNYSTIRCFGLIRSSVSNNPAIRIGSTSTNTFSLTVTGIKVERTSVDTSNLSTGVQLRNLVASYVDVRWCRNFEDGVYCYGDQANGGFSYNEIHLGFIHDNKRNLHLNAASPGYCNENNFYGGTYNHSSGYPAVATTNLLVAHFASSVLNNNRFYGPSFEDNSALATAAVINGDNNVIYWPRIENPAIQTTYQIQFTVNARECRVIGHGFTMVNTNISDLGTGNMYETREGAVIRYQTTAAAGKAVLKLQSYASGSAKVLSGLDTAGTERSYITGDGDAYLKRALALEGVPASGTAGAVTYGAGTQFTVGGAGGASALPATPLGYLRAWVGTTEVAIPYYHRV